MESRNPVFSDNLTGSIPTAIGVPMTIQGALTKLLILCSIMAVSGFVVWQQFALGYLDKVNILMMTGLIVGLIVGFVIIFKQNLAPVLSPVYAFAEGALLGGMSAFFETKFPGIVMQAVALTFMAIFSMAILYKAGIIKATEKFRSTLIIATFSIFILYMVGFIASFFGVMVPAFYSATPIGIAFSVIVTIVASLNLIIDFDFIEQGAARLLPQSYEWYGAFGLLITIVWVYIEMLRLLSKLRER